jgi:hypothetical protein
VLGEPVIGPTGPLCALLPAVLAVVVLSAPALLGAAPPLVSAPPLEFPALAELPPELMVAPPAPAVAPDDAPPAPLIPPAPPAGGASEASTNEHENSALHFAPTLAHLQSAEVLHQPSEPRDLLPGS